MKIQSQVCTYEQAKKLRELGVATMAHCTLFIWVSELNQDDTVNEENACVCADEYAYENFRGWLYKDHRFPALTVGELGQMLPAEFGTYYSDHLGCWNWQAVEPTERKPGWKITHQGDAEYETEAEARADALIHALENGIVTVFDVNTNLVIE